MTTTYAHDSTGAVSGATTTAGGNSLYTYALTRDVLDRIIRKVETIGGVTTDWAFAYDAAGRLGAVTRDGIASAAYQYDANGNRTRRTSSAGIETGVVDAQDRFVTYGNTSYQYTDAGELRRAIAGPDTTTYHYDALGALRWVTLPTGARIDYVIDAMGRRIGKKVNGAMTQGFLYESDLRIAAELSPSGAVLSRFVYGAQVNVPEYMERGGVRYRLVTDHLGSVRLVVAATTGTIQQRLDYDEYGRIMTNTNPGFQPFGYAGGLLDDATGLVRFGARDYDASAGRFVAKDPLGFVGGDQNLYRYVTNDPLNLNDPQGKFIPIAGAAVLVGGLLGGGIKTFDQWRKCSGANAGEYLKAFGEGFVIGAVGTATTVGLGAITGVGALVAGAGGGLAAGLADGYFAGKQDLGALLVSSVAGGVLGKTAEEFTRGPGFQPNKWAPRPLSGYGPNSIRALKGEGVGDILSGSAGNFYNSVHDALTGGDCGCR